MWDIKWEKQDVNQENNKGKSMFKVNVLWGVTEWEYCLLVKKHEGNWGTVKTTNVLLVFYLNCPK